MADALAKTIEDLSKRYGKPIIMKGNEVPDCRKIPTGIPAFDYVTNGGFLVNQNNELYGAFSSLKSYFCYIALGKFQKYDWGNHVPDAISKITYKTSKTRSKDESITGLTFAAVDKITTVRGYKPTNEVVAKRVALIDMEGCIAETSEMFDPLTGFVGTLKDYIAQQDGSHSLVSWSDADGSVKVTTPSHLVDSGVLNTWTLRTKTTKLQATPTHPILVWREGKPTWLRMEQLVAGDYIARPRKIELPLERIQDEISCEDAELLGMLLGDGSLADTKSSIGFTNIDESVWQRLEYLLIKWDYSINRYDDKHGRLVSNIQHKYEKGEYSPLRTWLMSLGVSGKTATEKFCPPCVLNASEVVIRHFLKGLVMTDGCVSTCRVSAYVSTSSHAMSRHVKYLLHRLGIVSRIQVTKYVEDAHNDSYSIWVNGYENFAVLKHLTLYSYKGAMLDTWLHKYAQKTRGVRPSSEYLLPGYGDRYNYRNREKFVNNTNLWWDEVVSIEPSGKARCYDVTVPTNHSWVVNDIVVHNTYDRAWGERLGIDNEGLLYYCADSMNQAIDVIEALLREPEVCLVVLDSMSIIGSDMENEKSMEEDQMAANARLWNKAARKLRSALNSNRDATLIAINATSTSMSAYGDPETVKNGNQWKLFKSLSVRLNGLKEHKGKLDGVSEVTLGRNISLKNKKQKFGPPYREAEFYYSLVDDGVTGAGKTDIVAQLCELGMKLGVITRSGTTYEFGEVRAVGLENFKNKIRESVEVQKTLSTQLYEKF